LTAVVEQVGIEVERFEWVAATPRRALLRLAGTFPWGSVQGVERSRLIAELEDGERELDVVQGLQWADEQWSCAFAAPYSVIEAPGTRFRLELGWLGSIALPPPAERVLRGAVQPVSLPRRVTRLFVGTLSGAVLGVALWSVVSLIAGSSRSVVSSSAVSGVQTSAPPARRPTPAAGGALVPPGDSLVAQARLRRVAVYPGVGAAKPKMVLTSPNPDGALLVFLVRSVGRHRLKVLLPTRPNLSRGWIARSDVQLALNPYRIEVQLRRHLMTVWHQGRVAERDPVGVGRRAVTPTPFGQYFITELLKQTDPSGIYGPYAFGLSAHSNVLHEFAGGNGEIGIHGTDQPWLIGRNVSHGCIRVRNDVITRLAGELPLGTPVQIAP
jgi:lipoprotein-anchoring transpeptidase ErfK/SrfK